MYYIYIKHRYVNINSSYTTKQAVTTLTDFSSHVADGAHTSARDGVHAWTEVLYYGTSTALHSQDTSHLQNNVLGRRPA